MRHAATVFSLAAGELIARGKRATAAVLDTTLDRVDFSDGRFAARESNRSFDFLELAQEMTRHKMPDDHFRRTCGRYRQRDASIRYSERMRDCEIEIDPESCDIADPLHLG